MSDHQHPNYNNQLEENDPEDRMECGRRYHRLSYLGAGAYGTVCSAMDRMTFEKVAIKKCKDILKTRTLAKRTLREIRLLRYISHPHIITLKKLLPPLQRLPLPRPLPRGLEGTVQRDDLHDLYLVFELMETDLAQIIRSPQELGYDHIQYFMYQLLSAVDYLHQGGIVHRDIKPRNILINADCTLKLADFGLARQIIPAETGHGSTTLAITDYVTTRWYRAPEVLAGWVSYGFAVDMWAIGCILVELINRTPLFPGRDTLRQLEKIVGVLGKPQQSFINRCMKFVYRRYLHSLPTFVPHALKELMPNATSDALDLIKKLLTFFPEDRLTAKECLAHPFLTSYMNTQDDSLKVPCSWPPLTVPSTAFQHERGGSNYDINCLYDEILAEVEYYRQKEEEEEEDREELDGDSLGSDELVAVYPLTEPSLCEANSHDSDDHTGGIDLPLTGTTSANREANEAVISNEVMLPVSGSSIIQQEHIPLHPSVDDPIRRESVESHLNPKNDNSGSSARGSTMMVPPPLPQEGTRMKKSEYLTNDKKASIEAIPHSYSRPKRERMKTMECTMCSLGEQSLTSIMSSAKYRMRKENKQQQEQPQEQDEDEDDDKKRKKNTTSREKDDQQCLLS
eukprot:gene5466-6013_t